VARRWKMTDEERRNSPPWETEDVEPEKAMKWWEPENPGSLRSLSRASKAHVGRRAPGTEAARKLTRL